MVQHCHGGLYAQNAEMMEFKIAKILEGKGAFKPW